MNRRLGALEEYIESQVRERMRLEVEAMLDVLEAKLTREECIKMARIVMEAREDRDGN